MRAQRNEAFSCTHAQSGVVYPPKEINEKTTYRTVEEVGAQAPSKYQTHHKKYGKSQSVRTPRGTPLPESGGQHERGKKAAEEEIMKPRLRDPGGGLTAAGRKAFRRTEGAHLRPGVKKSPREMTPTEMKRKGSWATRFYGRKGKLPPLKDKDGKPTRFALTAAAWGEPVPKTHAQARKIAARGKRLLARYQRMKARKK